MPRGPRILPPEGMFHLIGRGNNGIHLFRHRQDFRQFQKTVLRFLPEAELEIHHYALMNTHFHLLAWVPDTSKLASVMKAILISYQHFYRRKYPHKGHLWHSRYRSIHIADENQWLQCARYIELNPVHAGICGDPKDYPWTSYRSHVFGKSDQLINRRPSGISMGEHNSDHDAYRTFVLAGIDLDYHKLKRQFEQERFICNELLSL